MAIMAQIPNSRFRTEELVSTVLAVIAAVVSAIFFFMYRNWEPVSNFWLYLLAWLVLAYLSIQLTMLMSSAIDSQTVGFIDSATAMLPFLVCAIASVEDLQGVISLSLYQKNALMLMLGTSLLEALITLWVRFTVNRRTIGIDTMSQ